MCCIVLRNFVFSVSFPFQSGQNNRKASFFLFDHACLIVFALRKIGGIYHHEQPKQGEILYDIVL